MDLDSLSEKIDLLSDNASAQKVHQENISETLKDIRGDMKEFIRKESQQDTSIAILQDNVNGIGKKLTNHINGHWKWIGFTLGIIGIISGLVTLYKR